MAGNASVPVLMSGVGSKFSAFLLGVSVWQGCVTGPLRTGDAADYGFTAGSRVWVRGPWDAIPPSRDVDEVIDQLCPAVMTLPRATQGDYGQEYCGALYSLGDGIFYASMPSPLGAPTPVGPAKRKSCYPPREVHDVRGRAVPIADFHSHPWAPSGMSPQDRWASRQIWLIRIQFDTRCTIHKLVPNLGVSRAGELYVRENRTWRLVGLILQEDKAAGRVTWVDAP